MTILDFLLWNPIGNITLHILIGLVVGMFVIPIKSRSVFIKIFIFSITVEGIIDGAHLYNASLTHNFMFMIELPLVAVLIGYLYSSKTLQMNALLFLSMTFSHMIVDCAFENAPIMLFYPFSTQTYIWSLNIGGNTVLSAIIIWISVITAIAMVEKKIAGPREKERAKKLIRLPAPLPYPIGR